MSQIDIKEILSGIEVLESDISDVELVVQGIIELESQLSESDDRWVLEQARGIDLEIKLAESNRRGDELIERCAVIAWSHFMDACKSERINPSMRDYFCAASAIRTKAIASATGKGGEG